MRFLGADVFLFKIIRKIVGAIVLLAIVIPVFTIGKTWISAHDSTIASADAIVVLGAAQFDGRPSDALEARVIEAKRIYDRGLAKVIFTVGGGAPGDRTTEAATSKFWLSTHGIKSRNIIAIEKGRDTLVSTQSYVAQMKKMKFKSVIIVTDPYHCLRAMTMANDLGSTSYCSPVLTGPNSLEHSNLRYLLRESGAYFAYITLGRRGIHVSDHLNQ
jgi:uncharacterized SAM-binding protein YcdF (DUF218 family)